MFNRIKERLELNKPTALGWGEWEDWHAETKANRPIAYFIMETIPDKWDDLKRSVTRPYNNARSWVRYRVFDKHHVIKTGLKPDYYELETRMLHGMFSMLIDFVEVQSAWMHVVFDDDEAAKRRAPWWSIGWTRFKAFRDPEAGLAHLRWEMTLDDEKLPVHERNPGQAEMAREVWELYHWWKFVRPQRPDPHDVSGWSEYCKKRSMRELFSNDRDPDDRKLSMEMINHSNEIEKAYDDEDEAMLIRLVKLRKSLWT
jgi:hypothetical protein